jgi:hypothetical protein
LVRTPPPFVVAETRFGGGPAIVMAGAVAPGALGKPPDRNCICAPAVPLTRAAGLASMAWRREAARGHCCQAAHIQRMAA